MQSQTLDINGQSLAFFYHEVPNSENLIVFLHGLGCSKRSFHPVLSDFRFLAHSFLMIDLAGFGESSKSDHFSYAMEDQAVLVEQLVARFNPKHVNLVVHSMGGAIGLLFSSVFYQRVSAFANLEGNLIGADCGLYSRGIVRLHFDMYRDRLFPKQIRDAAGFPMLDLNQTTPIAMYQSAQSLVQWSDSGALLEKYGMLPCRKMYFYGDSNYQSEVLKVLPAESVLGIPNSGHAMMFDNPDGFKNALYQFLFG